MLRQGSPPPSCNIFLPVVVTSSLFMWIPFFLLILHVPLRLPFSPLLPLFPSTISPLLHFPLSVSHSPTPTPPLFSSSSAPPPLSRVYCSRKASTDTSMCVFVHVWAATVDSTSELHTIMSGEGGGNLEGGKKKPCMRVKGSDQNIDCWRVTSQPCKQNPFKSLE